MSEERTAEEVAAEVEEEQGFLESFAEHREEEPVKEVLEEEPVVEAVVEPVVEAAPVVSPADDLAALASRLRNMEGKFGTVNKQLQDVMARSATQAATQGGDAPTSGQVAGAAGSSAKLKALQADFPEWAEALTEQLANIRPADTTELRASVVEEVTKTAREITAENRSLARLDAEFGTRWERDVKTDKFKAWLSSQDAVTKALSNSQDSDDASALLEKFYSGSQTQGQSEAPSRANRRGRLERAIPATKGGTTRDDTEQSEEQAFLASYKKTRNIT